MITQATRSAMAAWATAGIGHMDLVAVRRDDILSQISSRLLTDGFLGSPSQISMLEMARRYDTAIKVLEEIRAGRFDIEES